MLANRIAKKAERDCCVDLLLKVMGFRDFSVASKNPKNRTLNINLFYIFA